MIKGRRELLNGMVVDAGQAIRGVSRWNTSHGDFFFFFFIFCGIKMYNSVISQHCDGEAVQNLPYIKHKDLCILRFLHGQSHGCWWPGGDARSQGIISHGIDLVPLQYFSLSTREVLINFVHYSNIGKSIENMAMNVVCCYYFVSMYWRHFPHSVMYSHCYFLLLKVTYVIEWGMADNQHWS